MSARRLSENLRSKIEVRRVNQYKPCESRPGVGIAEATTLRYQLEITRAEFGLYTLEHEPNRACDDKVILVRTFRPSFSMMGTRRYVEDRQRRAQVIAGGVVTYAGLRSR